MEKAKKTFKAKIFIIVLLATMLLLFAASIAALSQDEAASQDEAIEELLGDLISSKAENGPAHEDTIGIMLELAELYLENEDFSKAALVLTEALEALLNDPEADSLLIEEANIVLSELIFPTGPFAEPSNLPAVVLLEIEARLGQYDDGETISLKLPLAYAYKSIGEYQNAERLLVEMLAREKELMEGSEEDFDLDPRFPLEFALADVYDSLGHFAQEAALLEDVLDFQLEIWGPEHLGTLETKRILARAYNSLGDHTKAIGMLTEVIDALTEAFGPENISIFMAKDDLAFAYTSLGNYPMAIALYREVIEGLEKQLGPEDENTLAAKNDLAILLGRLGAHDEAYAMLVDILTSAENLFGPDSPRTLAVKHNLGAQLYKLEDYQSCTQILGEVLETEERVLGPEHPDTLAAKSNLALAYLSLGDSEKAASMFQEVVDSYLSLYGPDHFLVLLSKHNLAGAISAKGDYELAAKLFSQNLEGELRVLGPWHPLTSRTSFRLGETYYKMGQLEPAIFYVKASIKSNYLTSLSLSSYDGGLAESFLESSAFAYHFLIKILTEAGRTDEAQEAISLLKLDEILSLSDEGPEAIEALRESLFRQTQEGPALDAFFNITRSYAALGLERERIVASLEAGMPPSPNDAKRLQELETELNVASSAFWDFIDNRLPEVLAEGDGYKAKSADALKGLQETLSLLGEGTVIIHTIPTDESLIIFLTTSSTMQAFESPISREDLDKKTREFYALLNNPSLDPRPLALELYNIIIRPLEGELLGAKAKNIMFSLDGPLRYIPMSALYDGEKWLVETYASSFFTVTSAYKLREVQSQTPLAQGFGVTKGFEGFPPLDKVKGELYAIIKNADPEAGVLEGNISLDGDFTKAALTKSLGTNFNILHIASHFNFGRSLDDGKDKSFLLLGDGDHLEVKTLKREMDFRNLDLLTLSACNTASGITWGDGSEVESFCDAALTLGAMTVLASLWPVNDESTGILMAEFYGNYYSNASMDKAEALRQAQLDLLKCTTCPSGDSTRGEPLSAFGAHSVPKAAAWEGGSFSHPYYWAPFVLFGNWK
ncbi:MAG: CHAT domain-containing protein [Deltaproteobacteria bacterium]|nr:CHAT domain-containing protein [Deltaproteobacteria bacterium]